MKELIETWQIHNRINLYLLEAIKEEHLSSRAGLKGRTVGEQFAHLHQVRLLWLKSAAPELLEGLIGIEKNQAMDKILLQQSISRSGEAITKLLSGAFDLGRVKGFKPHPTAFVGYLIAHEAHHRGQITLSLKLSDQPIDKKTLFGLWEWGVR